MLVLVLKWGGEIKHFFRRHQNTKKITYPREFSKSGLEILESPQTLFRDPQDQNYLHKKLLSYLPFLSHFLTICSKVFQRPHDMWYTKTMQKQIKGSSYLLLNNGELCKTNVKQCHSYYFLENNSLKNVTHVNT